MRISIIIPTFGEDRWRRMAFDRAYPSASRQKAHEVIVLYERHMTIAQVRNLGAEQATGEWLCFCDADDELGPGYVEAMRRALEQERGDDGTPLLLTPAVTYSYGHRSRHRGKIWPEINLRDGNWLCIGTLVPKTLFHEVGGFREWPLFEDWCFWQRCALHGARVVSVPRALYIAQARARSRNRTARTPERNYWHQRIGHENWPGHYEATTTEEDVCQRLVTGIRTT